MKRQRTWWIVGVLLLLAVAIGVAAARRGPRSTAVQVATVAREDVQAKVTANGKVQAQRKVDISATVAGQVTRLAVKEGDRVSRGQFLLQIDAVNPRALARGSAASMQALLREVDSARAGLLQARLDHQRAEENHRGGIIAPAELDRARTALATAEATLLAAERRVEQAQASLEGARDVLAKTTVRAPMDGVVTARRVEEGEVAVVGVLNQPGTVLLTISDMSVVETELEVDETSIPSVRLDQEARVRIDAYPNRTFAGRVTEVGSSPILKAVTQAQSEAIKFKVKVQIQDPPPNVKPGLSVQADILTGFSPKALVVPIQALVIRDREDAAGQGSKRDQEGVYLMKDGKAAFQPIKTGLMGELRLEVVEGLAGGEVVITGPFRALRDLKPGDGVRVEKPRPEASPGG
jgi:HlyD family secretion protein